MTAIAIGTVLEVTAEKLAFGGFAVARHEGTVVFVPYAAPGDRLRVEVTEIEKRHVRARIVEIVEPSPHRRAPRCRHFGACGGCNFQHVEYGEQVRQKGEFVRDALVRTGGFDWPAPVRVHHAGEWGYRSRTQLKLHATSGLRADGRHGRLDSDALRAARAAAGAEAAAGAAATGAAPANGAHGETAASGTGGAGNGGSGGGPRRTLGFHAAWSHSVVDVDECPVLAPELEHGLADVRAAIARLPSGELPYQIEGACGTDGASWAPDLPGLRKDLVEHRVLGFRYLVEPESFFQGNRFLVADLAAAATARDPRVEPQERGGLALDLYAGVGLFSLPLSRRFDRVIAVEDERRAATLGRVNVRDNGCTNVSYVRATTEQFLRSHRERPDLVLLDPPRAGAKPAIPLLLALAPQAIVYVSCDPSTLARDLRQIVDGGYELIEVEAFDLFPQTWHVETVARLRRRAGADGGTANDGGGDGRRGGGR